MTHPEHDNSSYTLDDFDLSLIIGRHINGDDKDTHLLPFGEWTYGDMVDVLIDGLLWTLNQMPTPEDQAWFSDDILRRIRLGSEYILDPDKEN